MKHHATVIILSLPVLFFLFWLQPFFAIRWFLSSRFLIFISKTLMILVSLGGLYGLWRFGLEIGRAITQKTAFQANLWLKIPLALVVCIIILFYYLPLITAS